MAQADGSCANASGSAFRADLNTQLAAVFTNHSGATTPATTFAYQFWADTTSNKLKLRNSANTAWIDLRGLDGGLELGTASSITIAMERQQRLLLVLPVIPIQGYINMRLILLELPVAELIGFSLVITTEH